MFMAFEAGRPILVGDTKITQQDRPSRQVIDNEEFLQEVV